MNITGKEFAEQLMTVGKLPWDDEGTEGEQQENNRPHFPQNNLLPGVEVDHATEISVTVVDVDSCTVKDVRVNRLLELARRQFAR